MRSNRRNTHTLVAAFVGVAALCSTVVPAEGTRLLRYADIHADHVAFVQAGDIWVSRLDGSDAARLTTHEGMEMFPKFSPDGRWIAFSAEYGGNRQVWLVSVDGGEPRQLTFYNDVGPMPPRGGFDYRVLDWTRDGKHVVVRANRLPWGVRMGRPYLVPVDGGMETPLPIPESGAGMLSPDGKKFVYTPIDREFRTWKRYKGGRAQDVWIYDLERNRSEQITDYDGTDNQPLWVGDRIYFTSDREGGRLNLWAYDLGSRETTRVTDHQDFDVLWPSAGPRQIVYEAGGWLYRFDPEAGRSEKLALRTAGDQRHVIPYLSNVADNIGGGDISPSGKRAVFDARGDVFTAPAEHGEVRNVTRSQGIREHSAVWSPDGKWIAYLSDRSGEYEIYVRPSDGSGEERRVTKDGDVWRNGLTWSPDSEKLAYQDRKARLRYIEVDTGKSIDVDTGTRADITDFDWSPDSRFIAYSKVGDSLFSSLYLYSLKNGQAHALTDDFFNDVDPTFDPEGRYLYFFSDRDYNLQFSGYEFNYFYTNPTRLYAATLQADGPALLRPKSDEEETEEAPSDAESEESDDAEEEALRVDVEGFSDRIVALPGPVGNYGNMAAAADGPLFTYNDGNGPSSLVMYSLEDEERKTILEPVGGFSLSADRKKLLYAAGGSFGIIDVKPDQAPGDGRVDTSGMVMKIDPRAEWQQIFVDGWRLTRDWFYDGGMHGVDWGEVRELYEPLVEHVAHRGDLDYILGEMGGELNAGHFYVNWGDIPRPTRIDNGLLGAEIEAHGSGYFRVAKIFPGENWASGARSPLTEAGVDVNEGDFILSVDGRSTKDVGNFYQLLEGAADRTVSLEVNDRPREEGARVTKVRPVSSETQLRYLDWVQERRRRVDELSDGRIGYIHLPNTAGPGNRELRKGFYAQAHKDALIVDVRYNGGGFIPDRMIELLTRQRLSFWTRRNIEPFATPGYVHEGPKVCLMNGYSSSGGDAFPYYFKKLGLGPLIGTRTWGGLIGLSGNPGFVDGGSLAIPTFRFLDTEGQWAVENVGVAPDIEVVDRSELVAAGRDPSLEKAVEVLLEELRKNPPQPVEVPTPPRYGR